MKITGTGLHPKVQGQVRLENFEATLPFSTLKINLGFLYFDPDDPLNPRIEMQGTSLLRDYTIRVYRLRDGDRAPGDFQQRAASATGGNHLASGDRRDPGRIDQWKQRPREPGRVPRRERTLSQDFQETGMRRRRTKTFSIDSMSSLATSIREPESRLRPRPSGSMNTLS